MLVNEHDSLGRNGTLLSGGSFIRFGPLYTPDSLLNVGALYENGSLAIGGTLTSCGSFCGCGPLTRTDSLFLSVLTTMTARSVLPVRSLPFDSL